MTDTPVQATDPVAVRRKRLIVCGGVAVAVAGAWGVSSLLSNPNLRSTDDAYVGGHVVQVTPEVAGVVTRVLADNTDNVVAGAQLVELDDADARIELAAAEAQLAQAVRNARGLFAGNARFDADVQVRRSELAKVEADLKTRQAIAGTGAVNQEDVRHAADAVRIARAALASAEQAGAEARTRTSGTTVPSNPAVRAAAERVRAAALAVQRTRIAAPVGGMVAQRAVQLGRRVGPGDKLMAVAPLDQLWIDANFKEIQLRGVCAGQPARITADLYGKQVVYHGVVQGIEAGTGAAFALLPAQNATGNWIKVVQRAPVRIRLDPAELRRNPLRIGMSTEVEIDTGRCDPKANQRPPAAADAGALYAARARAADAVVERIIAENIGG
ncbi:efflux RND transporter periplasmic adaptor subunit [Caulobacter mirabilis]|uniref:EmrA/EmrK family multidrug efflux transporter periplasmic adaptor subunit n=1 Tax=Caulobacter mirabilis TaxID=69666 RepID=A0A2D2B1E6_9CAUL|nr:efflux RND transporter periplasmic adaptor subunit [Caulobacter mirabilis]ATQ44043.1 EmrA/EmrK family multidrug efflux transporter periplasmic adaptor subunit [Caulobacter mirabilis]